VGTQVLQIDATVTAGPASASDSNFPSGNTQIAFTLNPPQKQITKKTGDVSFTLNSADSPFTLPEIGAASIIQQCTTFFFFCKVPMRLVITFADPPGADLVSVIPVDGAFVHEADPIRYIKSVTVQGAGDIEYFAAGIQ
jgi:hypothetical protein